jgi:hypothetical protein
LTENDLKQIDVASSRLELEGARLPVAALKMTGRWVLFEVPFYCGRPSVRMGVTMRVRWSLLTALVLLAAACNAQQRPAEAPLQIPNPHYVTIDESIVVHAPVDKVGSGRRVLRHYRVDELTRMGGLQVSAG